MFKFKVKGSWTHFNKRDAAMLNTNFITYVDECSSLLTNSQLKCDDTLFPFSGPLFSRIVI